eukprot:Nk52_evm2s210 gene=Nk52_evmTU2s210
MTQVNAREVVVDEAAVACSLYVDVMKHMGQYGGQYDCFRERLIFFIDALVASGFEKVTFLGDGVVGSSKVKTRVDRFLSSYEKRLALSTELPKKEIYEVRVGEEEEEGEGEKKDAGPEFHLDLFMFWVSKEVIAEHPHATLIQCDGEADGPIAVYAREHDCPVISNDSDFFLLIIPRGYIPYSSIDLRFDEEQGVMKGIRYKIYSSDEICRYFGLCALKLLYLLGTLCGNDYVSEEKLSKFHHMVQSRYDNRMVKGSFRTRRIWAVARFLQGFASPGEALMGAASAICEAERCMGNMEAVKNTLLRSINNYESANNLYVEGKSALPLGRVPFAVGRELRILDMYRHGQLSTSLLDVGVLANFFCFPCYENVLMDDCWLVSLPLRKVLYFLLLSTNDHDVVHVKEYGREKLQQRQTHVSSDISCLQGNNLFETFQSPLLGDQNLDFLLAIANVDRVLFKIGMEKLLDGVQMISSGEASLFILSIVYLVRHHGSHFPLKALSAILQQFFGNMLSTQEFVGTDCRPSSGQFLHILGEYQTVLYSMCLLDETLGCPLRLGQQNILHVERFYNGMGFWFHHNTIVQKIGSISSPVSAAEEIKAAPRRATFLKYMCSTSVNPSSCPEKTLSLASELCYDLLYPEENVQDSICNCKYFSYPFADRLC